MWCRETMTPAALDSPQQMGLFAPPLGVGYYAACAIGRVDPREGMRPILGYVLALLVGLAVVTAFPWISTGFIAAR